LHRDLFSGKRERKYLETGGFQRRTGLFRTKMPLPDREETATGGIGPWKLNFPGPDRGMTDRANSSRTLEIVLEKLRISRNDGQV